MSKPGDRYQFQIHLAATAVTQPPEIQQPRPEVQTDWSATMNLLKSTLEYTRQTISRFVFFLLLFPPSVLCGSCCCQVWPWAQRNYSEPRPPTGCGKQRVVFEWFINEWRGNFASFIRMHMQMRKWKHHGFGCWTINRKLLLIFTFVIIFNLLLKIEKT